MQHTPMRRAVEGAVVGGVCAGLARRWQVDPQVLRIAVVLLSLFAGIGIAVYVGALLLIPREGSSAMPLRTLVPATRDWSNASVFGAVVALGVTIIVVAGGVSPLGIGPAIGLAFLWYFGFHRSRRAPSTGPTASPFPDRQPTDFERAAVEWQRRVAQRREAAPLTRAPLVTRTPPGSAFALPEQPTPPPLDFFGTAERPPLHTDLPAMGRDVRPPAPSSLVPAAPGTGPRARWIWPLALCLAGGGLAGLAMASSLGASIPALAYWSSALAALALGLVASAWFRRPRGLLPVAILTGMLTLAMLFPTARLLAAEPPGSQQWAYDSLEQLPGERELSAGAAIVDLSRARVTQNRTVAFRVNAGSLRLKLPPTGNVVATYSVDLGHADTPNGSAAGVNLEGEYAAITDPTDPTLRVTLVVNAGEIVVDR